MDEERKVNPLAGTMDTPANMIARNLKRIRKTRGYSLSELAQESGIARATLYQLEAGSGNPTLETLFALASVLRVPFSELISDREPPPVQVIRSSEGSRVVGQGIVARLLRCFNSGQDFLELFHLRVRPGTVTIGQRHPIGVFEHVLVHEGRLLTGSVDNLVELGPGDYIAFRADVPHSYEALDGDVVATLLMQYPSTMGSEYNRHTGGGIKQ
jgi:transcriptional regulator with XRE-family HTH domain